MRRNAAKRCLPLPDEEIVRLHWLRPGVAAPDLETVKEFIRFYIATSRPQLAAVPTANSINTVTE
jgi:hypothetical protein